jgi:MoxR-like ATPase
VPNSLLAPLESLAVTVEVTGERVRAREAPLIFPVTNDERDLPPAFIRRCVELKIRSPSVEQLLAIGKAHFAGVSELLLSEVAILFDGSSAEQVPNPPRTGEYLDTIRACLNFGVQPGSPLFEALTRVTVWKHGRIRANAPIS